MVTKKLEQTNENEILFVYQEFARNKKKLIENIKNKFWLIENILRKLNEKIKGGKNW